VALNAGLRAGDIRVTYRAGSGTVADTTLDRLRTDEVIAALPVREFRWYKGRRHYSGWYWCATGQRLVVYESRLELARIMLADFDPCVTGIAAQPFLLTGADASRIRRHVPDLLLVAAGGGVMVVDVKAPSRMADPASGRSSPGHGGSALGGAGRLRRGRERIRGCWPTSGSWLATGARRSSTLT
jgi:hypothetical protein